MRPRGVTLIELLIAIAILGIILTPLVVSLVNSLRVTSNAGLASQVKASAVRTLEAQSALVARVESPPSNVSYQDDATTNQSYYFIDYFYSCPSVVTPPAGAPSVRSANSANLRTVACNNGAGTRSGSIVTSWSIAGESGVNGQGVVVVSVTATHDRGPSITMVNRISCYDIVPSPSADAPITCPPATYGGR